jgi:hypothetical protein
MSSREIITNLLKTFKQGDEKSSQLPRILLSVPFQKVDNHRKMIFFSIEFILTISYLFVLKIKRIDHIFQYGNIFLKLFIHDFSYFF